jgi:hypothetical protein
LIAANDGYWQGVPRAFVLEVIRRYVPRARCVFRAGSHAGVITPTNLTELFGRTLARQRRLELPVPSRSLSRFAMDDVIATIVR